MQNRGLLPPEEVLSCLSRSSALLDRRLKPQAEQPQKCPRCESINTKFCYYNNYSLSQPRYFCKTCRRYWTQGGTLRNVPVGGGCRKNKKAKRSVDQQGSSDDQTSPSANSIEGTNISQSVDSDQPGVSVAGTIYGFSLDELSNQSRYGAYKFSSGCGTPAVAPLSSVSPFSALQTIRSGFPALDLQAFSNTSDLRRLIFDGQQMGSLVASSSSGLLQQVSSEADLSSLGNKGSNVSFNAYSSMDHQWQRLLQQQKTGLPLPSQEGQVMPALPFNDDGIVNGIEDLRNSTRQTEGVSEDEVRVRGTAPSTTSIQHWQLPQEEFLAGSVDADNVPSFWNSGVAGGAWTDISGFGSSSSTSLL